MLVGITSPMYAVHFHARSWRALDSLALLLCTAGALRGHQEVQTMGIASQAPFPKCTLSTCVCAQQAAAGLSLLSFTASPSITVRSVCVHAIVVCLLPIHGGS